jgi:hypothetical protein
MRNKCRHSIQIQEQLFSFIRKLHDLQKRVSDFNLFYNYVQLEVFPAVICELSTKYGNLDVSQPYRLPWPVMTALPA